jgi:glycine/D-amino acid oxidase-like deaminating enzyme
MTQMDTFDVLIVGAGIIGAAAARELARAGMRVGILEAKFAGGVTTAAGMGHVVVMDDSPAQLALTAYSRSLWQEDAPHFPAGVEYESRGTIWVAADDQEMAEVHAKKKTYAAADVEAQVMDALGLALAEPNLRSGLAGGLLVPQDGVAYPPAAAAFYLGQARALGATLFSARVTAAAEGEVQLANGSRLLAPRIVLATGSDCKLMPNLPIQKRKGHLAITDRYPGFVRHQLVELGYLKSAHKLDSDSVAFNVQPRSTGQILIGSSRQYGSEDPAVEHEMLQRMIARAMEYMPGLAGLSTIRTWTGFRAATRDKLPLIGPAAGVCEDSSLWLAAGFEGLGITNAPGAACLLADAMLGRASRIDRGPYLPSRLALAETAHG